MSSFNKVILMGNLTRDVEMKYTPSGMAVAGIGLAINRKYRDAKTNELRDEVTFVDVECFGKQAETINSYMAKGKPIFIEGRLKLDSWDDKTTGKKVYKMKVVCEQFQFLGGPSAGPASAEQFADRVAKTAAKPIMKSTPAPQQDDFDSANVPEENIPF